MGVFKEYNQYDALGLAELVKKKEISPAELCEEAIERGLGDAHKFITLIIAILSFLPASESRFVFFYRGQNF